MVRIVNLGVAVILAASFSMAGEDFLGKHVCQFVFHGKKKTSSRGHIKGWAPAGVPEAAQSFARHAEVPICFEALHTWPGQPVVPIEINAKNTTVKDILDQMISQDPRYVYRERLGVIEVLPDGADRDPGDCLSMVIPLFRARDDWNILFQSLRCQVQIVARNPKDVVPDPWIAGRCGGSFPGIPHPPPGLIEASFENEPVRDILDRLCAQVGNMAWSARFDGPRPACDSISIHVYQPRRWSASDTAPLTWSEGLPQKCIKCHYHRPCPAR